MHFSVAPQKGALLRGDPNAETSRSLHIGLVSSDRATTQLRNRHYAIDTLVSSTIRTEHRLQTGTHDVASAAPRTLVGILWGGDNKNLSISCIPGKLGFNHLQL